MAHILTITGYAEAGKRTLARAIIRQYHGARLLKSVTTRPKRTHDLHDHYAHVSILDFTIKLWSGYYLWENVYRGHGEDWHRYATTRDEVERHLKTSRLGIMILLPENVQMLASYLDSCGKGHLLVPIFLRAPVESEHVRRLKARGASANTISRCLHEAQHWEELSQKNAVDFHYVTNTGNVEEVVREVLRHLRERSA